MNARRRGHAALQRVKLSQRNIEEREPLLGLPSLPIIDPLLGPIVTPLLGGGGNGGGDGGQQEPPTTQQQQPTTAAPPPATTSPPNTGSGSGTGGGGGGGQSGQTTTQPGGGNEGGNSSGSTGGGNGNGNGNGNGSSNGNGGSNGNGQSNTGGNTGGTSNGGTGNGGNGGGGGSSTGGTQAHPGSSQAGSGGTQLSGSQSANASSRTGVSGSSQSTNTAVLINAGSPPPSSTSHNADPTGRSSSSSGISSPGSSSSSSGGEGGGVGSGTGGGGGGGGGGSTQDGSGSGPDPSSAAKKMEPGAIAGIVLACLLCLLIIAVFIRRRRLIQTRLRRRNQWAGSAVDSRSYDFNNQPPSEGIASARSSFATSYDRSVSSPVPGSDPFVLVPEMAELRDAHGLAGTYSQRTHNSPTSPRSPPPPILVNIDDDRHSLTRSDSNHSFRSITSDPYSQGQVLYVPQEGLGSSLTPSPMSVRPFSPTEAFSFPKPPSSANSGHWDNAPRRSSALATNPFSDPQPESAGPAFSNVEYVRRPFQPTRDDEVEVSAGDRVSIIELFDDGWAAVRKVEEHEGKGKAKASSAPGLIPIDCFREQGLPLPDFLATTRVSGYGP
ncbi:hypothetical protein V5O48_012849 [Marasmius crinis-equi]|uniref:SH3 domain-containing protein n=1 Tax=Marasmius crinis-equi TaxID=585013 RepID=A0ABR3F1R2_9AGAR